MIQDNKKIVLNETENFSDMLILILKQQDMIMQTLSVISKSIRLMNERTDRTDETSKKLI